MTHLTRALVFLVALAEAATFQSVFGQNAPPPAIVKVEVHETRGPLLPGADLAVIRAGQAVLVGRSDDSGRYVFRVDVQDKKPYGLIARRIGYAEAKTDLALSAGDTLTIDVDLDRTSPTQLSRVLVEARRSDHFLDSSAIVASHRAIYDAYDAIRKLRPDMLHDRDRCGGPFEGPPNIWVNGIRVLLVPNSSIPSHSAMTRANRRVVPHIAPAGPGAPEVDSALASVKAEHIAEIRWVDCNDHSLPGAGTSNAIFITLKPGIGYDWRYGTFVADSLRPLRRVPPRD